METEIISGTRDFRSNPKKKNPDPGEKKIHFYTGRHTC